MLNILYYTMSAIKIDQAMVRTTQYIGAHLEAPMAIAFYSQ